MRQSLDFKRLFVLAVGMLLPMMILITASGVIAPFSGKIPLGPSAMPANISPTGNYGAGTRFFAGSNNASNSLVTRWLTPTSGYSSTGKRAGTWVAGPEDGIEIIYAIDAISADDVWAAGQEYVSPGESRPRVALIHWDGTQWWKVASAEIGTLGNWHANGSHSLKALSHDDVWLLGQFQMKNGQDSSLILHWNGKTLEADPHSGDMNYMRGLRAIDAVAPDDVWAVGSTILHYDGTKWERVPGPENIALDNPGGLTRQSAELYSVAVIAANDVWAVGTSDNRTLIIHWDGKTWNRMESPNIGSDRTWGSSNAMWNYLKSVSATSSDDVWAVGYATHNLSSGGGDVPSFRPLVLRWDGKVWRQVTLSAPFTSPMPMQYDSVAHPIAVEAVSKNEVWVVSLQGLMRWDGSGWGFELCPDKDFIGHRSSIIRDIAVTKPGEVWAVGQLSNYGRVGFVLDASDGSCATHKP